MSKQETSKGSISLGGILTIIFVLAKLSGYVTWSWWIVFAPLWVPMLVILGLLVICAFIVAVLD